MAKEAPTRMKASKPMTYLTRRLQPGDEFEAANSRDVRILEAIRKAQRIRAEADVPAPPPALASKIADSFGPDEDLKAARAEYVAAVGRQPFHGWDAATLREKAAAAKQG